MSKEDFIPPFSEKSISLVNLDQRNVSSALKQGGGKMNGGKLTANSPKEMSVTSAKNSGVFYYSFFVRFVNIY